MTGRFTPQPDGSIAINFEQEQEREFLESLAEQLRSVLMGSTVDDDSNMEKVLRRLFPVAYVDEPERQDEFASLTRSELLNDRLTQLETLERCASERLLKPDEIPAAMAALNSLRLVMGTALDVSESDDPAEALVVGNEEGGDSSPERYVKLQFLYLGQLLSDLVDAADKARQLAK